MKFIIEGWITTDEEQDYAVPDEDELEDLFNEFIRSCEWVKGYQFWITRQEKAE